MSWADLPADLLTPISARVGHHADYIRLRAVCRSWRCAVDPKPAHLPPQLPFLILPPSGGARFFPCFSPAESRLYQIPLADRLCYSHCLGSSHGWLVLVGPGPALLLYNPFARSSIPLPPATAIPFLFDAVGPADIHDCRAELSAAGNAGGDWWKYFTHRAKLCWDLHYTGMWAVVVFPKSGFAFYKPGQDSWSRAGRFWRFADVEFFKGKLYALTLGGILSTIDIAGPVAEGSGTVKETVLVSSIQFSHQDTTAYLVQSEGELLLVLRKYVGSGESRRTLNFEVYKLVESTDDPCWIRVDDLGSRLLIVECGTSVALSSAGLAGYRGNCIYFSKEHYKHSKVNKTDLGLHMYSLKDSSIYRMDCFRPDMEVAGYPSPFWITPMLW